MSAQLVYFTAPWCAPCKKFRPVVDRVAEDLGLKVQAANIDTAEGGRLAAAYGVSSVPTVIVEDGPLMDRFGVIPPAKVRSRLEPFA